MVFSLLLVVFLFASVAFPRVSSEGLVYIQSIVMIVLAEECIRVMYESSITSTIVKPEKQLHHLTDLPTYLRIRVHLELPKCLNPATRLEEVPYRALTLQSHRSIVLEKPEQCK